MGRISSYILTHKLTRDFRRLMWDNPDGLWLYCQQNPEWGNYDSIIKYKPEAVEGLVYRGPLTLKDALLSITDALRKKPTQEQLEEQKTIDKFVWNYLGELPRDSKINISNEYSPIYMRLADDWPYCEEKGVHLEVLDDETKKKIGADSWIISTRTMCEIILSNEKIIRGVEPSVLRVCGNQQMYNFYKKLSFQKKRLLY